MPDDAIQIRKLLVKYRQKHAVDSLTLNIPTGSVFALLGDNGAGKSTTMKVLSGQVPPNSGEATILGYNTWSKTHVLRKLVGYVPEKPKFYDWMTVAEIGWFTSGFHQDGYREGYARWVDQLQQDPTKKLKELSKGGYAKVGLALALAANPSVLLLDEPTSGLDRGTRLDLLSTLVELAAEGRTILISSHSISELERFCSHAAFLKEGKLLRSSTIDRLKSQYRRVSFRAVDNPPNLESIGKVLQRRAVGRTIQAVLGEFDPDAMERLPRHPGITDFEETRLSLEELYDVIMGKDEGERDRKRAPVERVQAIDDLEGEPV
jgi:ABC-2 type transport system ATP-binding protein